MPSSKKRMISVVGPIAVLMLWFPPVVYAYDQWSLLPTEIGCYPGDREFHVAVAERLLRLDHEANSPERERLDRQVRISDGSYIIWYFALARNGLLFWKVHFLRRPCTENPDWFMYVKDVDNWLGPEYLEFVPLPPQA